MVELVVVSILCPDRVGLVSAIADHLFAEGVNLRDTSFAALGHEAEFTSLCEVPESLGGERLKAGLSALPELDGAQIRVVPYTGDPGPGPMSRVTHHIEVCGGDQLGLIARLSDILTQFGANIVRLDAQKLPESEGGRYVTRFSVWIPGERAATCLAAIGNTAGSLGLTSGIKEVGGTDIP